MVKKGTIQGTNSFFCSGPDLIIRTCVWEDEMFDVFKACHSEPCGGNFVDKRTTYKVVHVGYYWPTLFQNAKNFVSSCDVCPTMGRQVQTDEMPLQMQISVEPLEK